MTEPTDQPYDDADGASDEPGLTPEQERDVRRMLADARLAEPVPGDVAARLDRVLAELAAGGHADPAPVVDLASHRRRRVATLLVAAAAVVAVGIGLGQVLPQLSGSDGSATSADSAGAGDAPEAAGSDTSRKEAGGSLAEQASPTDGKVTYALPAPRPLSEKDFSTDIRRLRSRALQLNAILDNPSAYSAEGLRSEEAGAGALASTSGFVCEPADWGAGVFVPVIYAGDPGVLVFRRAMGDTQVVDLYGCGSSVVLRSTTLPAP
ncbi:hypothetical protein H5V45_11570 [Nocardioides sp. KIGAM211]|uniref:Uncharacterized protein n=1 Tax=Nocardioides luti TaxID=2761101 RepID=A0A7X0RGY8_9ACTN|nr:hypothetical protein [Nocardioides luti]MBB6627955.1 hypothetical protein [Nocardioides luti]